MVIEHKGSHKANREELLKSPPRFADLIRIINALEDLTIEEKAFFALAITTGARVSEICNIKVKDLTIYGHTHNHVLPYEEVYSVDVSKISIVMTNLKNKKNKIKTASIIRNQVFQPLVDWIIDRYREIGPNASDTKLYTKGRGCAYWLTKKLGDDWFPHIFRHYYVSNLARIGVSPQIIKVAAGWSSLDNWNTYAHLTTKEIEEELRKHYGDSIPLGKQDKPLSMHQMIGAVAAKTQVDERIEMSKKNQPRKMSVLRINGEDRLVRLTKEARLLRDKLKQENKKSTTIQKIHEDTTEVILQVV